MSVPETGPGGGGPAPAGGPEEGGLFDPGINNLQFNYVMLLVSIGIGVTAIVAAVLAYICRGRLGGWIDSHYRFQITTFWMGLLYTVVATLLTPLGIGLLLYPLIVVWLVVRSAKGLQRVSRREPIDNPATWLW